MAGGKQHEPETVSGLSSTTYSRVHHAILADILGGIFAPGDRLKVADLCRRYGLSAMPIREALQQLQGEGLVVMSPNKGASVRAVNRGFITDVYDVRSALYTIIYRDVVAGADAKLDRALAAIQKQFDKSMLKGDLMDCRDQNQLLHETIESRCTNAEVSRLMTKYSHLTQSLRDLFGFDQARIEGISREHWRILKAVHARNESAAALAAQHHSRCALENMIKRLDERVKVVGKGVP